MKAAKAMKAAKPIFKSPLPLLSHPSFKAPVLSMYLGFEAHFAHLQQFLFNYSPTTDIYVYDRRKIDVAWDAWKNSWQQIGYRGYGSYQWIKRKSKEQTLEDILLKSNKSQTDGFSKFMEQNQFVIKNSFLDIHPYTAYRKMCSFLNTKPQKSQLAFLSEPGFFEQPIKDFALLPFLASLHKKYLAPNPQNLKLRRLQRLRDPTPEEKAIAMSNFWKIIGGKREGRANPNKDTSPDQTQKIDWIINNNFGKLLNVRDVGLRYGRKWHYAKWQ